MKKETSCRNIIQQSRHRKLKKRGRDKIKLSRHQLHQRHVATKQRLLRQGLRQRRSRQELDVATILTNWASNLKSIKKCIEIRAQLQNPINTQLLLKKRSSWRLEREIWVTEGSCILIFLFFSFLFFSFLD